MLATEAPFPQFFDTDGSPLDSGSLYFGVANQNPETNPITVYWDAAGTQPAAQPIPTLNGYAVRSGTIAAVYADSDYSLTVRNSRGNLVYMTPSAQAALNSVFEGKTTQTVLTNATPLQNYAALRAYGGAATGVRITGVLGTAQPQAFVGLFERDTSDSTSADNGGTVILDSLSRRWKRLFDGAINVRWFEADNTGATSCLAAVTAAWDYCLAKGLDLYFPAGTYAVKSENNFPFRQSGTVVALRDCKNITVFGDGPTTILKTETVGGGDVLQLNGLKNFHVRDLKVTATLSGSAGAGSNGVSVTGGWDNITIMDVWAEDLPGLDKTSYIDGGKGLTLQSDAATVEVGTLKARVYVKNAAQGFGFESNLVNFLGKKVAVDVDLVAEGCYAGVILVAGEASGAIPAGAGSGVRVKGHAINCQKDVVLNRVHGCEIDVQVVTTKTITERYYRPGTTTPWLASNIVVESLLCSYAKNSRIKVVGNKGECNYKAQIGGATAGSSGLGASTENCDILLDLGGSATVVAINDVNSGGATLSNSRLAVSMSTAGAGTVPAAFYTAANANLISYGPVDRLITPTVSGDLKLAQSAPGNVQTGRIMLKDNAITALQGQAFTGGSTPIAGLVDQGGTFRFGIGNTNGIFIDAATTSAALGAYVGKLAVYNTAGALIGYFPIYA